MALPACVQAALSIPEVLIHILEYVDDEDPESLPSAIRVNKHWFICGTDVLWRDGTCEALANVPQHRRQMYASKFISLQFSGDDEAAYHAIFQHLEFPRLKYVSLDAYRPGGGSYPLRQYLQPPLENLFFFGGELDDDLLQHLQTHCRRLKRIILDSPGVGVTAESFFNFIVGCRFLEHVKLDHLLTDELMLHLAGRSGLLTLSTRKIFSIQLLQQILTLAPRPFRALNIFHAAAPSAAVPLVVGLAGNLTNLHLYIQDADSDVLGLVSSLTNLHFLSLSFVMPTKLSKQGLMSLKDLTRLRTLDIGPGESENASELTAFESGFTDTDFFDMVSQFQLLFRIRFMVQCDLQMPSENLTALIKCWFPKLQELHISGDDEFSKVVVDAFSNE
ncbi:hypothetical protein HRG_001259 [Hirsutella rhossiliensis]|uniref:F-box domain-containing protein n=1 Tax=Hirsutella rhossiliensis TaxID=111463 RepID=A0A9P8N8S0_9HYPO|nr:uncharacterized protein HRG_01259 [Hirsutella rhossiliensis]KAH0968617.1 hypothetical protein HRG_01259 [Hirsutella rhossiliensis]